MLKVDDADNELLKVESITRRLPRRAHVKNGTILVRTQDGDRDRYEMLAAPVGQGHNGPRLVSRLRPAAAT